MLDKSGVEQCLGRVVWSSVGEEWCREKCWGIVVSRSVGEESCREVLGKGRVEHCGSV